MIHSGLHMKNISWIDACWVKAHQASNTNYFHISALKKILNTCKGAFEQCAFNEPKIIHIGIYMRKISQIEARWILAYQASNTNYFSFFLRFYVRI